MDIGTLIEFRLQGDRRLAVVTRPEGKKHWVVTDDRQQTHTLHPRQITYEIKGNTYKISDLPKFWQAVQPYLDPSSLEVAWELLVEDGESVSVPGLAQILFSDQSPELCYAAYYLLSEDKLYFKQKADHYEPRSATIVADIKHQLTVAEQKQQAEREFFQRINDRLAGQEVIWQESDRPRLEALEKWVLQPETPVKAAQEILAVLDRPNYPDAAWQLLLDLKWWNPNENLFLRRSQIPVQFSPKVLTVAQQCLDSIPDDADADHRLDLTHLKVYTIDDESTEEIDDGLSVEYLSTGRQRLWIHIADPSRLVTPGDELDTEARKRSTTVYLPTGMIPMFPPALATGPMSLRQGHLCAALSFGVILDETGAVQEYEIHPTLIKPTYRLTYEDVDEMLLLGVQGEQEIEAIAAWSKQRELWRRSQGAVSIRLPEAIIKVKDESEVTVELLNDTPSRQLVAEMMILAGEVAGRYGQEHQLPLPFRSQPQPELPSEEELLQLPSGPVRSCALRRCMPRSEMSTSPARHSSLALNTYTQVTSPIRRYTDLLAHFQIKAHLRGAAPPFSLVELQQILQIVTSSAYEATLVERQTNRYWGLEFLRRNSDQVWQALVLRWLREHENLGLILLEDLGLELAMRFNRQVNLGDRLEVQVSHADPRQDVIQFRELVNQGTTVN
ncbi:MAG: VacB/RNase II family 3'-5' exoribonuclease [Coleofasciculaceae cyanobacterium SM2_1_6]|nr:VacB/RNase II family 3'-5' exoribonuclease [Coleofasciculaceae cyanobacterium SM2_1_6]